MHEVALVITREDARVGRKQQLEQSAVAQRAEQLGLPLLKANQIGPSEVSVISKTAAELGVVVAYGALLPEAALHEIDWWNVHFSMLPNWRGAAPAQHAIIHGNGGGISIFVLQRELDSGPVLSSLALPSLPHETAGEYLGRLTEASIPLLLETLRVRPVPSDQSGEVSYAPKLSVRAAKLDLVQSASTLERTILGMNPEPGAWCLANGTRLKLLRAKTHYESNSKGVLADVAEIGTLVLRDKQLLVRCGGGTWLELQEVQPAGRNPMAALDWYRGARSLDFLE